jgi:hypothetical protein
MKSLKLYSMAWLLIVTWSDMGITKNGGDFESIQECKEAWAEILTCYKEELKDPAMIKYKDWGQPLGFCIQGERMNAPGIIYPTHPPHKGCG